MNSPIRQYISVLLLCNFFTVSYLITLIKGINQMLTSYQGEVSLNVFCCLVFIKASLNFEYRIAFPISFCICQCHTILSKYTVKCLCSSAFPHTQTIWQYIFCVLEMSIVKNKCNIFRNCHWFVCSYFSGMYQFLTQQNLGYFYHRNAT
jgi:hypothetical protein